MAYLVIGGVRDGDVIEIPDARHTIELAERPRFNAKINATVDFTVRATLYRRMPFQGNNRRFEVFAENGMTADEVIAALIKHYRPADTETGR